MGLNELVSVQLKLMISLQQCYRNNCLHTLCHLGTWSGHQGMSSLVVPHLLSKSDFLRMPQRTCIVHAELPDMCAVIRELMEICKHSTC